MEHDDALAPTPWLRYSVRFDKAAAARASVGDVSAGSYAEAGETTRAASTRAAGIVVKKECIVMSKRMSKRSSERKKKILGPKLNERVGCTIT